MQQLIEQKERLQPYLLNRDYIFIGPADQKYWELFIKAANELVPVPVFSINDVMSNKDATHGALSILPPGTPLRLFVISRTQYEDALIHDTVEGYCKKNNIDLQL